MQVVLRSAEGEQELDVELRSPEATLGDLLAAALPGTTAPALQVGRRRLPLECLLVDAGLVEGDVLVVPPARPDPPPALARSGLELVVVAGEGAGAVLPLPLGACTVGRDPASTLVLQSRTVSRSHCTLDVGPDDVEVVDDESANGTLVDGGPTAPLVPGGLLQVGSVVLRLRRAATTDRAPASRPAGAAGVVAFDRPPRPAAPGPPAPLPLPTPPAEPSAAPFGIASFVGALLLAGVVLTVVPGGSSYVVLLALTPFGAVRPGPPPRPRPRPPPPRGPPPGPPGPPALRAPGGAAARAERDRRREQCPDAAEALRRVALPSTRLWERRPHDPQFLQLQVGVADSPWEPPVASASTPRAPEVAQLLAATRLRAAPVTVDLRDGGVVGLVGDRAAALALARGLVLQAAAVIGPADLTIAVVTRPGRGTEWGWCQWLPHARAPDGAERWLADAPDSGLRLARRLAGGAAAGCALVVLDGEQLWSGKAAPARDLLAGAVLLQRGEEGPPLAAVVLAESADRLPAACTAVVHVDPDGAAVVSWPAQGRSLPDVLTGGLPLASCLTGARALARFEDPELRSPGAGLPDAVRLLPLLELERLDAEAVAARWRQGGPDPGAVAPLGVTDRGLFVLDLVRDGAHALIGGTTGSGKSELLRSLVAALAVHADPEHLSFVLLDYKGGAAFDACARLPHVVGLVTDLDEALGARALVALEAELAFRERRLRDAGADDLSAYLAQGDVPPLPRLVVVVDEFATLAAELPDFVRSLVGIAQRGRTLGVHLLLATQRPSGCVSDDIRANTNLRIALRVQDAADSTDVLGVPLAAELPRSLPGRAYVRLGPGEVLPLQTALVTCVTPDQDDAPVDVRPLRRGPRPADRPGQEPARGETDLARLVDAVVEAHALEGFAPPRRPWPEPLPGQVDLGELDGAVALLDEPQQQRQRPLAWDPAEGGLLLLGAPGSGTTTALVSVALSLASTAPPDALELLGLDGGAGGLAVLEGLPHSGSVVSTGDGERTVRLLRWLRDELERRRDLPRAQALARRTLVLVDGYAALRAALDDLPGLELLDGLHRAFADGPAVGLTLAIAADRPGSVPGALSSVAAQRWAFRFADPYDYAPLGIPATARPAPVPGRAVQAATGRHLQVGVPLPTVADAVARVARRWQDSAPCDVGAPAGASLADAGASDRSERAGAFDVSPARAAHSSVTPTRIGVLPRALALDDLGVRASLADDAWHLPVGLRESDLRPAQLVLHEGEHALVAGPARSGRSTALAVLARSLRDSGQQVHLLGTAGRRSPLQDCDALDRFLPTADVPGAVRRLTGPVALLVDDAEAVDSPELADLLAQGLPHLHVLAAGRADALRTAYGHWTSVVRRSRCGLLLRPDLDLDGDLLSAALPRRSPVVLSPGRGYLVGDGDVELVQVAGADTGR